MSGTLVAAFALLAACATAGQQSRDVAMDPLAGKSYLSTSVTVDGKDKPLVPGTRLRLTFGEGKIGVNAGCNSMGGAYRVDGTKLIVDDLSTTDMACEAPLHKQDEWTAATLGADPRYAVDGDKLVLTQGTTVVTLVDRRVAEPDQPLMGTKWKVDSLVDGESISSAPASLTGEGAYLVLDGKGKVTGNAGCNRLSGNAVEANSKITFSQLVTTKMACPGEADKLERAVLEVLEAGPLSWKIEADRLTLTAATGKGLGLRASK